MEISIKKVFITVLLISSVINYYTAKKVSMNKKTAAIIQSNGIKNGPGKFLVIWLNFFLLNSLIVP